MMKQQNGQNVVELPCGLSMNSEEMRRWWMMESIIALTTAMDIYT